jgi:hypothetical protein
MTLVRVYRGVEAEEQHLLLAVPHVAVPSLGHLRSLVGQCLTCSDFRLLESSSRLELPRDLDAFPLEPNARLFAVQDSSASKETPLAFPPGVVSRIARDRFYQNLPVDLKACLDQSIELGYAELVDQILRSLKLVQGYRDVLKSPRQSPSLSASSDSGTKQDPDLKQETNLFQAANAFEVPISDFTQFSKRILRQKRLDLASGKICPICRTGTYGHKCPNLNLLSADISQLVCLM